MERIRAALRIHPRGGQPDCGASSGSRRIDEVRRLRPGPIARSLRGLVARPRGGEAMPVRILILDDSSTDRELARRALERLPAPLGPAEGGSAADWAEAVQHDAGGGGSPPGLA